MESNGMRKASLGLIAIAIGALTVAIAVGILLYSGAGNINSSPSPTPIATPVPTAAPTTNSTPTPTSNPTATANSGLTVTYLKQSRNQTMIVIQVKLEPNSYIFQMNISSFILIQGGARISANINDAVIIGTQYSTLFFPINGYNGTDYHLSSEALPQDTVWITQ